MSKTKIGGLINRDVLTNSDDVSNRKTSKRAPAEAGLKLKKDFMHREQKQASKSHAQPRHSSAVRTTEECHKDADSGREVSTENGAYPRMSSRCSNPECTGTCSQCTDPVARLLAKSPEQLCAERDEALATLEQDVAAGDLDALQEFDALHDLGSVRDTDPERYAQIKERMARSNGEFCGDSLDRMVDESAEELDVPHVVTDMQIVLAMCRSRPVIEPILMEKLVEHFREHHPKQHEELWATFRQALRHAAQAVLMEHATA